MNKNQQILLIFLLNFLCSLSRWIPSERCKEYYSEEILDWAALPGGIPRCEPNGTVKVGPNHERYCERIIHSCSPSEMKIYHLSTPLPLEWSEVNIEYTKYLWKMIYSEMSNKILLLTGDSMAVQLKTAIVLYLYKTLGYQCTNDHCPNGFTLQKTGFNHLTNEQVDTSILPMIQNTKVKNVSCFQKQNLLCQNTVLSKLAIA